MNDAVTPLSGAAVWLLVAAAVLGSSVFEFAWTIAGVALPHMQGAFSATEDQVAWIMTAFVMGSSVTIACIGWLSDRFGRKQVFALSILGFTFSLVMCATSTTLLEASLWRFLQGVLGAGVLPLGQAITQDAFPSHQQGKAISIWGNGVVLGGILGPVIGGFVVEYFSWPWIFWLNVPLGLAALVGVWLFVPAIDSEPDRPMDWPGLFLLVSGLAVMQYVLNRGERLDWFASPEIVVGGLYAVMSLYLFVVHSATTHTPFFRAALFRDRNFILGQFFGLLNGAVAILPLVLMPLLLQNVGGYPAITAGGLIVFRGVGLIMGMTFMGRFSDRTDGRILLAAGLFLMTVSGFGMSAWTVEISTWNVIWTNTVQGVASGMIYVQITALTFSTLPARLRTEGFAVYHTVLFLGSAIGVAAILLVHTRTMQRSHAFLVEHIHPFRDLFRMQGFPEVWDIDSLEGLGSIYTEVLHQSSMLAYNSTFFSVALVSLLAIPFVLLFRVRRA